MLGGKRVDLPTAVVTLTKPLSAAWDQPTLPCPCPVCVKEAGILNGEKLCEGQSIPVPIYPQHQQIR